MTGLDGGGAAGDGGQVGELVEAARRSGIETHYWDTQGRRHDASPEALVAVLRARGAPISAPDDLADLQHHLSRRRTRAVAPVVVVWDDAPVGFELRRPEARADAEVRVELHLEAGGERSWVLRPGDRPVVGHDEVDGVGWTTRWIELEGAVPTGYHQLGVELDGEHHRATVIVAPTRVVEPGRDERTWGVFAPLYSLRSELGLGPDCGDLQALAEWAHGLGSRFIATLPLLAAFLDEPFDPSPYAPVSRRFWNELYLDVEAVPEWSDSPGAQAVVHAPATQAEIASLRRTDTFEYRRQARLSATVIDELAQRFFHGEGSSGGAGSLGGAGAGDGDYQRFLAERPDVVDYARFRAEAARQRAGWSAWPEGPRSGRLDVAALDPRVIEHHLYAQYAMHRQLGELRSGLDQRDQRLYLDLPVGAHRDGYDTWSEREVFAWGMGTGAPPDDFFPAGQNWGFPPLDPDASSEQGHRHVAECVRHHLRAARVLRLDHVMQLERLFWVPDGMDPLDGVYVRYPREELLAVLSVESHRSGGILVGEDLGTVPDEIRAAMAHHGVLGTHVAEFALPGESGALPGSPPHRSVASIDTHDTPTFVGFVRGLDIDQRRNLGFLDEHEAIAAHRGRAESVAHLRRALVEDPGFLDGAGPGEDAERRLLRALLQFLGESEAAMVLVSLDDLWGETNPHNVPGTGLERPNWVHRMRDTLGELASDAEVANDLAELQGARLGAHALARRAERRDAPYDDRPDPEADR